MGILKCIYTYPKMDLWLYKNGFMDIQTSEINFGYRKTNILKSRNPYRISKNDLWISINSNSNSNSKTFILQRGKHEKI